MTINEKIIKNKLGMLNLAEELGNVSRACKVMGFLYLLEEYVVFGLGTTCKHSNYGY